MIILFIQFKKLKIKKSKNQKSKNQKSKKKSSYQISKMGDGYRLSKRCNVSLPELRSLYQKTMRRGEVDLAVQCASELIHNGHAGAAINRLLIFIAEDYGVGSIGLFDLVLERVLLWHQVRNRNKVKITDVVKHKELCEDILSLVSIVASPHWVRCRGLPLACAHSLEIIDKGLVPKNLFIARILKLTNIWVYKSKSEVNQFISENYPQIEAAWKLTSGCRLVHAYAVAKECFPPSVLPRVLKLTQPTVTNERMIQVMTDDFKFPVIPDYAIDKHVIAGQALKRDMNHFFTVGALIVNKMSSANTPAVLLQALGRGKSYYFEVEEKYGTANARSDAIRKRLNPSQPKKRKSTGSSNPRVKKTKEQVDARQQKLREFYEQKIETQHLVGKPWLQRVTGGGKVPTWKDGNNVWKGPFPETIDLQISMKRHQLIAQFLPYEIYKLRVEGRYLVMDFVDGYSPFGNNFQIPDRADFIVNLVLAATAKLCLTNQSLGDLVPRNMIYLQEKYQFVPIDLEDNTAKEHKVSTTNLTRNLFRKRAHCEDGKNYALRAVYRKNIENKLIKFGTQIKAALDNAPHIDDPHWSSERFEQIKSLYF